MKKKLILPLIIVIIISQMNITRAQETNGLNPSLGCDFVTSYIWRGLAAYAPLGDQNVLSPSLQPGFSLNYKGLEVGTWGSIDFTGTYKELDLYLSYSVKGFTATVTDYYWSGNWIAENYFEYQNDSTSHYLEASLGWEGESIPLSILIATMFYGADKQFEDQEKNNFSTYIELGYAFAIKEYSLDLFFGVTPMDGLYGDGYGGRDGFAIVNTGVKCSREIKITDKFSLPVNASLIANPQGRKLFLVFGVSI